MTVPERIFSMLKQKGLKQQQLADALGVSKYRLSEWKSGKTKSYESYMPKIAEFLGVSIDYLYGLTDNPNTDYQLSGVYLSLAKDAQENEIDPEDIKLAIKMIKTMKKK
jgi:transcriptional regulator with XRE-family HTH domain